MNDDELNKTIALMCMNACKKSARLLDDKRNDPVVYINMTAQSMPSDKAQSNIRMNNNLLLNIALAFAVMITLLVAIISPDVFYTNWQSYVISNISMFLCWLVIEIFARNKKAEHILHGPARFE